MRRGWSRYGEGGLVVVGRFEKIEEGFVAPLRP